MIYVFKSKSMFSFWVTQSNAFGWNCQTHCCCLTSVSLLTKLDSLYLVNDFYANSNKFSRLLSSESKFFCDAATKTFVPLKSSGPFIYFNIPQKSSKENQNSRLGPFTQKFTLFIGDYLRIVWINQLMCEFLFLCSWKYAIW
jgi:hypothetical protein